MALYNIERPATLSEVVGQENIKRQLLAASKSGKDIGAMLFIGPRGTGKTSTARIWARTLNCENPAEDGSPCGECPTCRAIAAGACVDVVELDAASNNGVEDVHRIVEQAQYTPTSRKKVFILDEVHMFSNNAWNALLKTIEEPPQDVVFILCTTEEHKVPATIISRCRKFVFERLGADIVRGHLEAICDKYGKCYDADALTLIARASDGCMRDALSILESFFDNDNIITDVVADTLGLSDENKVFDVLEGIQGGDAGRAVSTFRQAMSSGCNISVFIKALVVAVTDALYLNQGASIGSILNTEVYKSRLSAFAGTISIDRCMELTARLSDVYGNLSKAVDAEFLVESAILQTLSYESELEALKQRVGKLEQGVVSAPVAAPATPVVAGPEPAQQGIISSVPDEDSYYAAMAAQAVEDEGFEYDIDTLPDIDDAGFGDITPAAQPSEPVIPAEAEGVRPSVASVAVNTEEVKPAPEEPVPQQEAPVFKVIEGAKPKAEPAKEPAPEPNLDDIIDLLPKGTKVVGIDELEKNLGGEEKEDAVETESSDSSGGGDGLPGFGFDGLDGWL